MKKIKQGRINGKQRMRKNNIERSNKKEQK